MAGTMQGMGRIVYSPDYVSEPFPPMVDKSGLGCKSGFPGPEAAASFSEAKINIGPITLTLPYPISANRYWASRTVKPRSGASFTTTYVTKEAKEYKAQVARLAAGMGIRSPILGRVRVDILLYPHRPLDWKKRMRDHGAAWDDTVQCLDLDNCRKVVYDSLKGVVMEDDKWVRKEGGERMEPDEFGARLVVTVTPIPTEQPQGALL